jgi:hypothetical protein
MRFWLAPFLVATMTACAQAEVDGGSAPAAKGDLQGYGKDVRGGAGKPVCVVRSNVDECFQPGNRATDRTIVFAAASVSGPPGFRYIGSNVTLDGCARGQSGVTIRQPADAKRGIIVEGPASNVVVRCIRFEGKVGGKQPGATTEFDLFAIDGDEGPVSHVLVDRVTVVGSTDGALDITGDVSDVTVQRSLIYGTPLAQLIKYGQRRHLSLHHNVYAGNGERNPQIRGDVQDVDFVSNVVVDCSITHDGLGNQFAPYGLRIDHTDGPVSLNVVSNFLGCPTQVEGGGGHVYASGNAGPGAFAGSTSAPNPVPRDATVTPTPVGDLAASLSFVGSPNRTSADRARLESTGAQIAAAARSAPR